MPFCSTPHACQYDACFTVVGQYNVHGLACVHPVEADATYTLTAYCHVVPPNMWNLGTSANRKYIAH